MSRIIEIEEFGFPKSLIIREGALVSELIDTKDLVNELNEQLHQCNVSGRSEQLSCGRNITTCVFYKKGGKCSNPEYCRDQTT